MSWQALAGGALGLVGGYLGNRSAESQNQWNISLQKEFAQHGIRWRVEDAKKAGINPLYALGAPAISASPTRIGGDSLASSLQGMGQDITRSALAGKTRNERLADKMALQSAKLDLQGKEIDNAIRASQLRKMQQVGPSLPSPVDSPMVSSQGSAPSSVPAVSSAASGVRVNPINVGATDLGKPFKEAGAVSDIQWVRTSQGGIAVAMSEDFTNRGGEDGWPCLAWAWRNSMLPNFTHYPKPPKKMLPKGATDWEWSYFYQQFMPVYRYK